MAPELKSLGQRSILPCLVRKSEFRCAFARFQHVVVAPSSDIVARFGLTASAILLASEELCC